ncbi:MAG: saccharopine dehydrogenase NADP-binding domain-containing protein [Frankiaceae bacterium]
MAFDTAPTSASPGAETSSRIVLFGATGYTGRLTARALVDRGSRPVLAGRHVDRLASLAAELGGGLETVVADVRDPASVRALVGAGDVLISTVGPFARYGRPAVAVAVDAGAHYLDSTGEAAFIREVFTEFGPRATRSALLTAFGCDYVPGNLAGALALAEAPAAVRVDIGYFVRGAADAGGISSGTRASAAGMMIARHHAWRNGRIVLEPAARHVRTFPVGSRAKLAASIGGTEQFALPRIAPQLTEVEVYLGWFGPATRPLQVLSVGMSALTKVPGATRLIEAAVRPLTRGTGSGPDAGTRARRGTSVVAVCSDADGNPLSQVLVQGVDGYDFTATMLAWGAEQLAAGAVSGTGALGPVDAFGLAALERGCAEAGIVRS